MQNDREVLLRVEHVKKYFSFKGGGVLRAVDDVSFDIKKGEIFGLVGESGCGKTTTGRTVIRLYNPSSGSVYFKNQRVSSSREGANMMVRLARKECKAKVRELQKQEGKEAEIAGLRQSLKEEIIKIRSEAEASETEQKAADRIYRERRVAEITEKYRAILRQTDDEILHSQGGTRTALTQKRSDTEQFFKHELQIARKDTIMTQMQMIFQDPIASINPRMTVREIIAEGLIIRGVRDKKFINEKVYEMLELVGLVREHADRYPHEFSGGQRQRIGIARAIVMKPELIIADEPISALDVSIQAQVINLLRELREKMGLTIIFIAHNLSVVKYFSDRIAVMYYGKIVEMASSDELFLHPLHPYTKSLLSAIPYPDPRYEKQRQRITYTPALAHDYTVDKPELCEIIPEHYILCNRTELEKYRLEMGL